MDTFDLFRKLSTGIKFDKKRFESDAKRFQLLRDPKEIKKEVEDDNKVNESNVPNESLKRKHKEEVNENEDHSNDEGSIHEEVMKVKKKKCDNVIKLLNNTTATEDGVIIQPTKDKKQKTMTEDKILKQQHQKVNECRNKHNIHVTGTSVPPPIETFEELSTSYDVESNILKNMTTCGYTRPTTIQMQTIPVMLQQRNLLACAPTGSGKTAAFLLPVINQLKNHKKSGFRAVILAPTRELAQQIYRECLRLSEGFRLGILANNLSKEAFENFGQKNSKKFDIFISTPLKLASLLRQESDPISLAKVKWLIIDEADKLFEEGNRAFKDQIEEILKACQSEKLRCAMFSATNPVDVTRWSRHNLRKLITITIGRKNAVAETIEQELTFVGNEQGKLMELRDIFQKGVSPPVLIFVQSKERAQELFKELIYDGINVDVIHSDRTQAQRDNVVRCFREGRIWVLISTELMGRGIDFKGVNLVINYDFPRSAISYIHRIGRTGRAGHKGKAITFFTHPDIDYLKSIAKVMRESGCQIPDYMFTLKQYSKKKRRKLENTVPERENICTIPGFKKNKSKPLKKNIKLHNGKKTASDNKVLPKSNIKHSKLKNEIKVNGVKKINKKSKKGEREMNKSNQD